MSTTNREELFIAIKLCEQAANYDEMVKYLKELITVMLLLLNPRIRFIQTLQKMNEVSSHWLIRAALEAVAVLGTWYAKLN